MYEKPASTAVALRSDLIQRRWSPRAFSGAPIDKDALVRVFEAARWASSRSNTQPWRFIVAAKGADGDTAEFDRMHECVMGGNQKWSKNASAYIAVLADLQTKGEEQPNHGYLYDVGLAVSQMVLEALANDLVVHQMAGIYKDKVSETYGVPESHAVVCILAVGGMGNKDDLEEPFYTREINPRDRKPLTDLVFGGAFGQAADL